MYDSTIEGFGPSSHSDETALYAVRLSGVDRDMWGAMPDPTKTKCKCSDKRMYRECIKGDCSEASKSGIRWAECAKTSCAQYDYFTDVSV